MPGLEIALKYCHVGAGAAALLLAVTAPSSLGAAAEFTAGGNTGGYNPCGLATPVRPTTWSGIKSLYR